MNRTIWYILIVLAVAACLGCEMEKKLVHGSCKSNKVDGKIDVVTVALPYYTPGSATTIDFNDRDSLDAYIDHLESLVIDLKEASQQMRVFEPGEVRPPPPVVHVPSSD